MLMALTVQRECSICCFPEPQLECYPCTVKWNFFIRHFCLTIKFLIGSVATNSFYMFACVTVHKLKLLHTRLVHCEFYRVGGLQSFELLWSYKCCVLAMAPMNRSKNEFASGKIDRDRKHSLSSWGTFCGVGSDNFGDFKQNTTAQ